jgi:hypothetical protein
MNRFRARAILKAALAAALAVALGGCIFDPRDPEPPTSNTISYLNRGQPKNVLENCGIALSNLDIGGYEDALGDGFRADDVNLETVNEDTWDRAQEISFATWLFGNNQEIEMNLFAEEPIENEVATDHFEYTIIYALAVTSNAGQTQNYRAQALVDVKQSGAFWYVDRWVDQVGEVDPDTGNLLPTMGSLRAAFVSK